MDGNTNLAGGMLAGLELGNLPALPEGMLVRVILFTDGHANAGGATNSAQLLPLLDAHRGRATLSAFGYGQDADQELLSDLALRGAGNYAFVATPDDASSAFARELGGLLSTYATDLEVKIVPAPGVVIRSVLSDVDVRQQAGELVLRMDDLLAEEGRFSHAVETARVETRLVRSRPHPELDIIIAQAELQRASRPAATTTRRGPPGP